MTADLVRLVTPVPIPSQYEVRVELGSTDASNVVPDEFKADMVTVIRDKVTGDPLLLVVVEPQGREDDTKKFSWPAYLANLRAAHRCESAVLIVICWNAAEAEKCRAAIAMGHPGYVLVPIVIGPRDGEELNGATPWLTVLAGSMGAIDLETEAGRRTVLDAIRDTHSSTPVVRTLTAIILGVAPDAARTELEALMEANKYQNDFVDRYFDEIEALAQARLEARGMARGLLRVLRGRGVELTTEQEERVMSCRDSDQLDRWIEGAAAATSASDVFKD
jgi:hypothetical protein